MLGDNLFHSRSVLPINGFQPLGFEHVCLLGLVRGCDLRSLHHLDHGKSPILIFLDPLQKLLTKTLVRAAVSFFSCA